jgi:hypothetical protein
MGYTEYGYNSLGALHHPPPGVELVVDVISSLAETTFGILF